LFHHSFQQQKFPEETGQRRDSRSEIIASSSLRRERRALVQSGQRADVLAFHLPQ